MRINQASATRVRHAQEARTSTRARQDKDSVKLSQFTGKEPLPWVQFKARARPHRHSSISAAPLGVEQLGGVGGVCGLAWVGCARGVPVGRRRGHKVCLVEGAGD